MDPADGHGHVLGPQGHERPDEFPSSLLAALSMLALALGLLLVLARQASQHALQRSHSGPRVVDPPSLHPIDVLVGVTVLIHQLLEFGAGSNFVLDHVSSIGPGRGQGNAAYFLRVSQGFLQANIR